MVACQGCQREFRSFVTWSHIKVCTGLSLQQYKEKFRNPSLVDESYRRRVAQHSAERWHNLSERQRQLLGERISRSQKALPKSFRKRWLASRLNGFRRWLSETPEVEKQRLYSEHSKKIGKWWARLTATQKRAIVTKRNFWAKLSNSERDSFLARTLDRPDVRQRSAKAKRDWWNKLSAKERTAFLKKHLISSNALRKAVATRRALWDNLSHDAKIQFSLKRKAVWAALPESVKQSLAKASSKRMKMEWGRRGVNVRRKALRRLLERRGMTKGERVLARLFRAYPEIEFTGNGAFWVTSSDGAHLNPDFVVHPFRKTRKVIEYFGYTGRKPKTFEKIRRYKGRDIFCLAIFPEDLAYLDVTKRKVAEFLREPLRVALGE